MAGGSGSRMQSEIPKQFLYLSGRPVLMYTLEAFSGSIPDLELILVLPESHISYWQELCKRHSFDLKHKVIPGGSIRGESVRNGINSITGNEALVAIHDGVRPFVDFRTIDTAFRLAATHGSAVPAREISDSVRIISGEQNSHFDRKKIRTIQTPQCFRLTILKQAYSRDNLTGYTDDAGLVEELGFPVSLFEGNAENIKITTPFDLMIADAILKHRNKEGS